MRCNEESAAQLQAHLYAFKKGLGNQEIREAIVESIKQIEFPFRVGMYSRKSKLVIRPNTFIGYHGTTDRYVSSLATGITPKVATGRQFSGKGFYIALDRRIAYFFAAKMARKEGGNPVLLSVCSKDFSLVGKSGGKFYPRQDPKQYDFIEAPIDGMEEYGQYYVFENSLQKIRIDEGSPEPVTWTKADDKALYEQHRHTCGYAKM